MVVIFVMVVVGNISHTGDRTYFGSPAASIVGQRQLTSFDKGISQFTWLMIRSCSSLRWAPG